MKRIICLCLIAIVVAMVGCKKEPIKAPGTTTTNPLPSRTFGGEYIDVDSLDWKLRSNGSYIFTKKLDTEITQAIKKAKKTTLLGYIVKSSIWPMPYTDSTGQTLEEAWLSSSEEFSITIYQTSGWAIAPPPGKQKVFVDIYTYDK